MGRWLVTVTLTAAERDGELRVAADRFADELAEREIAPRLDWSVGGNLARGTFDADMTVDAAGDGDAVVVGMRWVREAQQAAGLAWEIGTVEAVAVV